MASVPTTTASQPLQITVTVNFQHVSLPPSQWCSGFKEIFEWGSSDISSQIQLQVQEAISTSRLQNQTPREIKKPEELNKVEPETEPKPVPEPGSELEQEPEKKDETAIEATKTSKENAKDKDDANGLFFQPYKHGTIFAIPSVVPSAIGLAAVHPPNSDSAMQYLEKILETVDTATIHSLGDEKIGPTLTPPPAEILSNDGVSLFKVVSYPIPPIAATFSTTLIVDSIPIQKFCFVDSRGHILFTTDLPLLMHDSYEIPGGFDILTGRDYLGNFDYKSMFLNCSTHTYQYTVTTAPGMGVPDVMKVSGRLSRGGFGGGCSKGEPVVKFNWSSWALTTMGKVNINNNSNNNNNNSEKDSKNNNNNKDGDNSSVATLKLTDQKIIRVDFRKELTFLYKIWIIVISWHIWARRLKIKR